MTIRTVHASAPTPMYRPSAPEPSRYSRAPSMAQVNEGQALKLGHKGASVKELQQQLNEAGARPPLDADGMYGPKTEAATRAFQGKNGLQLDGLAGSQTIAALQNGATFEGPIVTRAREEARTHIGGADTGHPEMSQPVSQRSVSAKPGLKNATGSPLQQVLDANPNIKTNQDFINYCYQQGQGNWSGANREAKQHGLDLNNLVNNRSAAINTAGTATGGADNPATVDAPAVPVTQPGQEGRVPEGSLKDVFLSNREDAARAQATPTASQQRELDSIRDTYQKNEARYERVAQATGVPAKLIAAIHYRESSGNFNTYLHQGDPLGKPAVHVPRSIPVFNKWEDAAIHALKQKSSTRDALGMNAETTDPATLATFAERYNGLGYHNKGLASPYVWSGTDAYTGGFYVSDHNFSRTAKDPRPGVMAVMNALSAY